MFDVTREQFYDENIANINHMIFKIMVATVFVPISFVIFTAIGFWAVPNNYSVGLFCYSVITSIILFFLGNVKDPKFHKLIIYIHIFCPMIFVDILGYKSVIIITITYCVAPVISCLYYNIRLTRVINVINFAALMAVNWIRSKTILDIYIWVDKPNRTPLEWFIENGIGVTVESFFIYMITVTIAKRTSKTLSAFIQNNVEKHTALDELRKRNDYIVKINSEIEQSNIDLKVTQFRIIQFVAQVLGSHDLFTGRHVMHTKKYVEIIARELKNEGYYTEELTDDNIEIYSTAAFLHDIGKIHIPEGVLNKIGKFTPEEFQLMKIHPEEGRKLLEFLPEVEGGKFNKVAKDMAFYHHEKWDGSGYPNGISGTDIPLSARIMAAADVLDALISQRLYKEPMSIEQAMDVFRKAKGLHFEPCIADAVINLKDLIEIIDNDFKTSEASTNAEELEWWQKYHSKAVKWEVKTDFYNSPMNSSTGSSIDLSAAKD